MTTSELINEIAELIEDSNLLYSLWESDGGALEYEQLVEDLDDIMLQYDMMLDRERFRLALENLLNSGCYYNQLAERLAEEVVSYSLQ